MPLNYLSSSRPGKVGPGHVRCRTGPGPDSARVSTSSTLSRPGLSRPPPAPRCGMSARPEGRAGLARGFNLKAGRGPPASRGKAISWGPVAAHGDELTMLFILCAAVGHSRCRPGSKSAAAARVQRPPPALALGVGCGAVPVRLRCSCRA
jgi:hypothetical protein